MRSRNLPLLISAVNWVLKSRGAPSQRRLLAKFDVCCCGTEARISASLINIRARQRQYLKLCTAVDRKLVLSLPSKRAPGNPVNYARFLIFKASETRFAGELPLISLAKSSFFNYCESRCGNRRQTSSLHREGRRVRLASRSCPRFRGDGTV